MANTPRDLRPIQVFLDAGQFIARPPSEQLPRASKDFFAGNDTGFKAHKQRIKTRVEELAADLRRSKQDGAFVKVRQRDQALAKSYRPLTKLFSTSNDFAFVGADFARRDHPFRRDVITGDLVRFGAM